MVAFNLSNKRALATFSYMASLIRYFAMPFVVIWPFILLGCLASENEIVSRKLLAQLEQLQEPVAIESIVLDGWRIGGICTDCRGSMVDATMYNPACPSTDEDIPTNQNTIILLNGCMKPKIVTVDAKVVYFDESTALADRTNVAGLCFTKGPANSPYNEFIISKCNLLPTR